MRTSRKETCAIYRKVYPHDRPMVERISLVEHLPELGRVSYSSSTKLWPRSRIVGAHSPTKIAVSRRPLAYSAKESSIESRVPPM